VPEPRANDIVTPPSPPSPPAPPMAPQAPRAPASPQALDDGMPLVTHGQLTLSRQPAQAFVLMGDGDNFVNASLADLKQARRDARDGEPVLWVRRGQARYLIRDPAVLRQLGRSQSEVAALGEAQADLGDRQSEIGEQMAKVSMQVTADVMAHLDVDAVTQVAAQHATLDAAAEANQAARQARKASAKAVDAQQLARVAREQAELGREQARLAQQQSLASARAARDVRAAIDQALSSGKAERLRD
ncbi:MAG: hypothetical protein RR704_18250, partial [Stenotrophomonas sp.]